MVMLHPKRITEVFGISNVILPDSYVDRGALDENLGELLRRTSHIALRGASKCGKSWLRQSVLDNPIIVQCRLGKTLHEIYQDALAELGIRIEITRQENDAVQGRLTASGAVSLSLLAKVGIEFEANATEGTSVTSEAIGKDLTDLRFVADLLIASERRLVIEDFHYLSVTERPALRV